MQTPIRLADNFNQVYPGAAREATECAMNLVRAADLLIGRVAGSVRQFSLTPASGLVLSILNDAGRPMAPNEISTRLIISRAAVTGLLDSLEKRGYVRREMDPSDRRMRRIYITQAGREVAAKFRPLVHRRQAAWLNCLSTEEQELLVTLLGRIQQQLLSLPEET